MQEQDLNKQLITKLKQERKKLRAKSKKLNKKKVNTPVTLHAVVIGFIAFLLTLKQPIIVRIIITSSSWAITELVMIIASSLYREYIDNKIEKLNYSIETLELSEEIKQEKEFIISKNLLKEHDTEFILEDIKPKHYSSTAEFFYEKENEEIDNAIATLKRIQSEESQPTNLNDVKTRSRTKKNHRETLITE